MMKILGSNFGSDIPRAKVTHKRAYPSACFPKHFTLFLRSEKMKCDSWERERFFTKGSDCL
jgi:hypothetical protein